MAVKVSSNKVPFTTISQVEPEAQSWLPVRDWMAPRLLPGPEGLDQRPGGHILLHQVTQLDISSTAIRRIIRAGRSPRYLLPDAVLAIIERESLYRDPLPD